MHGLVSDQHVEYFENKVTDAAQVPSGHCGVGMGVAHVGRIWIALLKPNWHQNLNPEETGYSLRPELNWIDW